MRSNKEVLKEIISKEKELKLYGYKVFGISIWRLIRFQTRTEKLYKETGYTYRTVSVKLNKRVLLLNYVKSLFQFFEIFIKRKQYTYLILAFPRLVKQGNEYFDKFTDPLITQTNLKSNSLVLQRNLNGSHFTPRFNGGGEYKMSDFVDYTSKLLGVIFSPFFYLRFYKTINGFEKKASNYFKLSNVSKINVSFKIGEFAVHCFFVKRIIKVVKPEKILFVNRAIFLPYIAVANKNKIPLIELQHGITHSDTELYAGPYQEELDPNYFFSFGEKWIGNQFSIPISQQMNIGWAYNSWVLDKMNKKVTSKSVLVVSSPAITNKIIKTLKDLAILKSDYIFALRLHPQEELTQAQIKELKSFKNIKIDDKEIDSLESVLKHEFIVGENSSVLYEALSLRKKVGKIMFNGLESKNKLDSQLQGIFYLNKKEDFKQFISKNNKKTVISSGIYDIFDIKKFNNLLKN